MKKIEIYCYNNQKKYESISECARDLKILEVGIRKYFKEEWLHYKGYTFKKVEIE